MADGTALASAISRMDTAAADLERASCRRVFYAGRGRDESVTGSDVQRSPSQVPDLGPALALPLDSMHLDRQRLRFLGFDFWDVNAQHAILALGLNALGIDVIRQHKTARESTVNALDADGIFALILAL